ncbi:ankyrin unc44 [Colletotrichum sojae]|uniref:Ankyrin unc44 n=1 Tax=Colletotrichum sojae TaxID=2175907 RepID=A0A8H6JNF6_9PEZI|nr:ankyrin unc44 [Colletotrichum sojae]
MLGYTALHHAAMYDHGAFIKEIIRWYPGLNLNPRSNNGSTPIHFAAVNGASSAAKALIEIDSATIVTKDKEARFPLHLASWFGHLHCATMLASPDTINTKDKFGATPLKIACRSGYKALVQFLLEQGADIDQLDNDGLTPMATALENQHLAIVTLLLDRGADPRISNRNGTNIFHLTAQYGDRQLLEKLIKLPSGTKQKDGESIDLAGLDIAGQDVMTYASFAGSPDITAALYAQGIPIDGFGHSLRTPLCVAAESRRLEFVKAVVSRGARLERNESVWHSRLRQTPLHFALKSQSVESARVLLAHGADPTLKDNYGICGLDYIARDPTLSAEFGYLLKSHVPVDSSSLKNSYARVVVYLSCSIIEARTAETKAKSTSNRLEEIELYEVLKRLGALTGGSSHKLQLYAVDFTSRHSLGRYCDSCRSDVTAPWFSCTSCTDLDLCPSCYDGYITSEPPRTIGKSVTALWKLEDDVYPVLRVAAVFRNRGANFLPISFRLLGRHALTWIDSTSARYASWEHIGLKDAMQWDLNKMAGWRFARLLEKLRNLDWPDATEGDILEAGQKGTAINIHDELVEIFTRFIPWYEHPRPACNGHEFVEILPREQLSPTDQERFDDKGHLKPEFFHELIKEYGNHGLPPLEDVCDSTEVSTWDPSEFVEKPKAEASGDGKDRSEKLETIRTELLEAASASSVKKTESENAEGQKRRKRLILKSTSSRLLGSLHTLCLVLSTHNHWFVKDRKAAMV